MKTDTYVSLVASQSEIMLKMGQGRSLQEHCFFGPMQQTAYLAAGDPLQQRLGFGKG